MAELKTKRQKATEKAHKRIAELYAELSKAGGSKTAMWEELEKKTGYSRVGIQKALKKQGIDYTSNLFN